MLRMLLFDNTKVTNHFFVDFVTADLEHLFNRLRIGKCDEAKAPIVKMYVNSQLYCSLYWGSETTKKAGRETHTSLMKFL